MQTPDLLLHVTASLSSRFRTNKPPTDFPHTIHCDDGNGNGDDGVFGDGTAMAMATTVSSAMEEDAAMEEPTSVQDIAED